MVLATLAASAALSAVAAAGVAAAPVTRRLPTFESFTLENGLEVAVAPVAGAPAVSVQVWYRAGAVEDPTGKRGLARLFEQLAYAGSAHLRPGDHRAYLASIGGTSSAQVSEDAAVLADTVPAARLDLALALEAERMRGLELSADAVAGAIATSQLQIKQQAQSALWQAYRRLVAAAFVQHPYGHAVAADPAELESITAGDVRRFYDAWYQPSNALLVVVGGVEPGAVRRAVEARFGQLARVAPPGRPAADRPEPPQSARRREEVTAPKGMIAVGFHIPAAGDPAIASLQLIGQLLVGGKSARLGRMVTAGKLTDVGGQVMVRHDPGLLLIYAAAPPGQTSATLEDPISAEIAALARTGPTAAELARARKQITATVYAAAQSVTGLGNQAGIAWVLTGKPAAIEADLAALAAVTPAAVQKAARTFLAPDRATIVLGKAGPEAR